MTRRVKKDEAADAEIVEDVAAPRARELEAEDVEGEVQELGAELAAAK